jgi:hypothetical protein
MTRRGNRDSKNLSSSFMDQAVDRVIDHVFTSLFPFFPPVVDYERPSGSESSTSQRSRFRVEIWKIRRLLRTASEGNIEKDISEILRTILDNRARWERAIVVWVDLIEVLVQTEEQKFGPKQGLGPIKKAEVKEVISHLLQGAHFKIPRVPDFLMPALLEIGADWLVDTIVFIANRYGFWKEPEGSVEIKSLLALIQGWLKTLLRPVTIAAAWIATKVWRWFHTPTKLSPNVLLALEAVEREGLLSSEKEVLTWIGNLFQWFGDHRTQLTAMSEIVFFVVQEVEEYTSLTGPEKKAYAMDLMFAVLDELGFQERAGLMFALIESMTSTGIEVAVHLFNKEGIFEK